MSNGTKKTALVVGATGVVGQACLRHFAALPDWGTRLAWVGERLLPPAGYLRALYGEDLGYPTLLWRRLRRAGARLGAKAPER